MNSACAETRSIDFFQRHAEPSDLKYYIHINGL